MTSNERMKKFVAAALCGAMPFGFAASCDSYGGIDSFSFEKFDSYQDDGFDDTGYYVGLGIDTLGLFLD